MPGSNSIYVFVKEKLLYHGAGRTKIGQLIINDKRIFLDFVQLERAVRMGDFNAVQSRVCIIDKHLAMLGVRHLIVFAYLYLEFSAATPKSFHQSQTQDGGVLWSVEYRRPVTADERLIVDWARLQFERVGRVFLGLIYMSQA